MQSDRLQEANVRLQNNAVLRDRELKRIASKMNFKFNVLARNISHDCLTKASRVIYTERQVEPITLELRCKYLLQIRNAEDSLVKMSVELRNRVQFKNRN